MTKWCDLTPEGRQKNIEYSRYRQEHYEEVLQKSREKDARYRAANREKIREKARIRYTQIRERAGKTVKPHPPKKPRDPGSPVELPEKSGGLDKICQVTP